MVTGGQVRTIHRGLTVLRAGLVLALPITVAMLWGSFPKRADLTTDTTPFASQPNTEPAARDLAWYAPLWQRDLKQPPIPPAPRRVSKPSKERDPLPVLLATLVQNDSCFAHFRNRRGEAQLRAVSELIDTYEVLAIEAGRVQLRRGEDLVWVELPKENQH